MENKPVSCQHDRHEFGFDLGNGNTLLLCRDCLAVLAVMLLRDIIQDAIQKAAKDLFRKGK